MANQLNQNPVVLDGVMASTFRNAVASPYPNIIRISKLVFDPAAVGDTFQIQDPNGDVIAEAIAPTAGTFVLDWVANPRIVSDFKLSQISGGTLYLYLR